MFPVKYAVLRQIESIFFNYRRRNFVYKMIRGLIWANFLFYLASGFAFLLNCLPREKIWHPSVEGRCIDHQSLLVATGIINVISDFTIMTIPLAVISQLQMPLKSKIGTGVVFSIGILYYPFSCVSNCRSLGNHLLTSLLEQLSQAFSASITQLSFFTPKM